MNDAASDIATLKPLSKRAQANREKIFLAAITLIRERGYDAVTMSDIAKAAGVARASVFNHFPAKLAFLGEWFERFTYQVIEQAKAQTSNSCRARLGFLLDALAAGAEADREIIVHIASLAMGHGPLAATESELDDALQIHFLELIEAGQANGEIRAEVNPGFLADLFVALLTVTAHDWVNRGQETDLSEDLSDRFDALFSGVAK